jgi:hypothetical protein
MRREEGDALAQIARIRVERMGRASPLGTEISEKGLRRFCEVGSGRGEGEGGDRFGHALSIGPHP